MTFTHSLAQIPSETQIRRKLTKIVFGPKGPFCPSCVRRVHVRTIIPGLKWRCARCRKPFSLTSVTWLRGMKISLQHLWTLVWCWQRKMNVQQVRDLLGLSVPTIRRWYALFRDHLDPGFEVILEGRVQTDEMFVKGGFVVGGKDIARKKVRFKVISAPYPTKKDAADFVQQHVRPGSILATDGGAIYKGIEKWWPLSHISEIHKRFEFEITSEIEGMWGCLRTFMRRMYHHVTFAKLPMVVAEYEARYSQPELFVSPLAYFKNALQPVSFAF